jgi:1,4-dihydroxy-2-naphthoyl-CoA hydrolase
MKTFDVPVRMYDSDIAGIIYFASQFRFAHEAFESFLDEYNISIQRMFTELDYIFVIVNANSDYLAPIYVSDVLEITCGVSAVGTSSFTMSYTLVKKGQTECVGRVSTTHVCLDKRTRTPLPIPQEFLEIISENRME